MRLHVLATSALTLGLGLGGPALGDIVPLGLNCNFNGAVHAGESGSPDAAAGFRSISDRALDFRSGVPADLQSSGAGSGLAYTIIDHPGVLDLVHLGDRNVVSGGAWDWDANPDGDSVGVQPTWLPDSDQEGPQTTNINPPIGLGPGAEVGVLYHYSNGGGDFDVTLGFVDGSSITVTVNAPDWFGALSPAAPGFGVRYQARRGTFDATGQTDRAVSDGPLNVVEAVIDAPSLLADLGFDVDGRSLNSIAFSNRSNAFGGVAIYAATVLTGEIVVGNEPPEAPMITEPQLDGQVVNAADVHMEATGFTDSNGDGHFCSNWEIWTASPPERVWSAACVTGLEKVHIHLGDGVFENALAGATQLLPDVGYILRVRFRDDSGDPISGWSAFSERLFTTGPEDEIFPMLVDDVLAAPGPEWVFAASAGSGPVALAAASPDSPYLRLESPQGELLAQINPASVDNPAPLPQHVAVRIRIGAGSAPLALQASNLSFTDDEGVERIAYLPAVVLGAGEEAVYWLSGTGASYVGAPGQTAPDLTTLARDVEVPWLVEEGFVLEHVAGDLQLPVNIAFVPNPGANDHDPVFYVTELYGTIKVMLNDGHVQDYAAGLINFDPTGAFPGSGEQGLAGLAIDPDNGDVYVGLLYESPLGPHYPRVVRLSSTDGGATAAMQTTVLDMFGEQQGQSHQISNLSFGPDGMLYVHMGDGFDSSTAQDLDSFRGKILRLHKDGTAPADNPFYDAGDGITARDYIFAYGYRNPFGGAWREADGRHYVVENGPSIDRMTILAAGRNYLWNGFNESMLNFAIHNWNPSTAPVNCVFIQPSAFGGSGFPTEKAGHLFITESGPTYATGRQDLGKRITEWVLNTDGTVAAGPFTFAEYIGTGKATCAALAAGPDGLYFSDFYKDRNYATPIDRGSNIWRIRMAPPPCEPDRDGDADADVFDLLNFLDEWFVGCQ